MVIVCMSASLWKILEILEILEILDLEGTELSVGSELITDSHGSLCR